MNEHPKNMTDMTRRDFFGGAVAAAFAAKVALVLPASAQIAARAVSRSGEHRDRHWHENVPAVALVVRGRLGILQHAI